MLKTLFITILMIVAITGGALLVSPSSMRPIIAKIETIINSTAERAIDTKILPSATTTDTEPKILLLLNKEPKEELSVEDVIDATNIERVKGGLVPLSTNSKLITSANRKAADMLIKQYFEHTSPSGDTVSDLGRAVGYNYVVMGENLALGNFGSAKELMDAWMNSPGHRANIMNDNYQEIGASVIKGTYQGKEVWFAVQHFGTARGVCPTIDGPLKQRVDQLNADLKIQEKEITTLRKKLETDDHPEGAAYEALIAQFNQRIGTYNAELSVSQREIAKYNAQVVAFNKCLAVYQ